MNKEIEDALHTLLHCSLKDTEYETQFEQFKIVRDYITDLQQENKQLKEELEKKNKKYWQQQCAYYSSILYSLEEWLKEEITKYREKEQKWIKMHFMDFSEIAEKIRFEVTLDKIQELKEKYKC